MDKHNVDDGKHEKIKDDEVDSRHDARLDVESDDRHGLGYQARLVWHTKRHGSPDFQMTESKMCGAGRFSLGTALP